MRRFLVVLAALCLSAFFVIPAGATGSDPERSATFSVSKTVLDGNAEVLTTLPEGEFVVVVTCEKWGYTWDNEIVFDQSGDIVSLPDHWSADGAGKVASYTLGGDNYGLSGAHCSVAEDASSSALQGNGEVAVSYACSASAEPLGLDSGSVQSQGGEHAPFGCTSSQSGQFSYPWDDECSESPVESVSGAGYDHDWCAQSIWVEVTNQFVDINVGGETVPPPVQLAPKFPG